MVFVAITAVAIVSLKYASETWEAIVFGLVLILFSIFLVVALVDRGRRQAFAIGMAVIMAAYTLMDAYGPQPKFRHSGIPTNPLLMRLHRTVAVPAYFDQQTGQQILDIAAPADASAATPPNAYIDSVPRLEHFMRIGHMWFAILFGYIGGLFARFVYIRRLHLDAAPAGE